VRKRDPNRDTKMSIPHQRPMEGGNTVNVKRVFVYQQQQQMTIVPVQAAKKESKQLSIHVRNDSYIERKYNSHDKIAS